MEILELTSEEYSKIFPQTYHVYNSASFSQLNKYKVEKVHYLIFKDNKVRLGIVLGESKNNLLTPFSAPFGGFQYLYEDVKISQIEASIDLLDAWAVKKNIASLKVVLPPSVYHKSFITKQFNCLLRADYKLLFSDINHYFDLNIFDEEYLSGIWHNARKNYKRSLLYNLEFIKVQKNDFKTAYEIIAKNRLQRGFPLRMALHQVEQTAEVISMDAFMVVCNDSPIAAAIVSHVTKRIVQVVYWGDLPEYSDYKTMNFLSYNIFKFYHDKGFDIVDIGPSTEDGIPNYGLCEFKESIGCMLSNKFSLLKLLHVHS